MTLIKNLTRVVRRSQADVLHDVIGAAALCVLLVAALYIPQF